MSTIPLSIREGHGQTLSGSDAPPDVTHRDDDGKLDELIDSVTETITVRDSTEGGRDEILLDSPADGDESDNWRALKATLDDLAAAAERGPATGLDRALKAAVDRRASQEAESVDFRHSRDWRDALEERYAGRVAIGDLLENFADWHERLKADPHGTADAIASAYLEQPSYALPNAARVPNRSGSLASAKHGAQTLDGALAAAIDRHHGQGDGEQQTFAASARHRAALKEMFPGMSYAEACRRVVTLDGDLHRDPLGTATRLAATYGLPVTSSQHVIAEERSARAADTQHMIAAATEHLPGLADMEEELVAVLSHPDFGHGPDLQENLWRAHRVVEFVRQEQQRQRDRRSAADSAAPSNLDGLIAQAMRGAST